MGARLMTKQIDAEFDEALIKELIALMRTVKASRKRATEISQLLKSEGLKKWAQKIIDDGLNGPS
jgi:hypothetical protein